MHADEIGVAVAQFAPSADRDANVRTIAELTAVAAGRGADVVLFPEYASYFTDPFDESLAAHAEALDGPFVTALSAIAKEHGIVVVAGMVERASQGRVRNTVVAVGAGGLLARYRKLHLYDAFGQRESDWIEPGRIEPPQTFTHRGLTFALMTCYDLRFPEVGRILVDAGAQAILVAAEWVRGPLKEHHWRTLLQARAIENTVAVAGADHPPPIGVGASMIIDAEGVERAGIGAGTGVAVAFLSTEAVAEVRERNPALALRRFSVTGEATKDALPPTR